jgi:dephospho-CoA kinase
MLTLKKIAVTGGIASGKSTVCHFFQEYGAFVLNADEIVHTFLSLHSDIGKKVIALLGEDIVVQGTLSRETIACKVFCDPYLLKSLEELLHPEVQRVIEEQYSQISKQNYSLFIVEIPLLFEGRLERFYDVKILVIADEKICEERFLQKTGKNASEFKTRNQRFIPQEEKIKMVDFVIENNRHLDDLKQQVTHIYNHLTRR